MAEYVGSELKRFNYLMTETHSAYHEAARRIGLSDSAATILYTICNAGTECPLSEIIRITDASKQTVNSALRRLESEGIVYLKSGGGRKKTVCLTEAGAELAQRTVGRIIRAENEIFESWTDEDMEMYLALTRRYLDSFREKVKEL